ncbi:MAG TPA: MgtC/SapB family protein [Candidatus Saccharimonadales bacterium]|nr:MgtC/SapB family protein [Candidatus Saccharimonadales bacterium]
MEADNDTFTILSRVVIALIIGAIIGIEREVKHKPAGIRTHMLVAGASALFLLINQEVVNQFLVDSSANAVSDPTRIIQAIVIGVSFIGAGTILKSDHQNTILYLTTAASILFTAAIGIVVGLGLYILAVSLAAIVAITLFAVGKFEKKFLD